jgi:ATP-dependent DNA helicase RecG
MDSFLSSPVQFISGIGPKRSAVLEKYGVHTIRDLLFYIPRRYLDRSAIVRISELRRLAGLPPGSNRDSDADVRRDFTVVGDVRSFRIIGFKAKARFVLILGDETGTLQCVWFGGVQYWKNRFRVGETLAVSGQPTFYGPTLQFVHPDIDRIAGGEVDDGELGIPAGDRVDWSKTLNTGGLIPLYPSGQELEKVGLDSAGFRRVIGPLLKRSLGDIREALPARLSAGRKLMNLPDALQIVHTPRRQDELNEALRRLKYDEFFYYQLMLAMKRRWMKSEARGIPFNIQSKLPRQLVDSLPFRLTNAQVKAVKEITADMEKPAPLNRLLQGDVGSGKTVVALICMLIAVENGYQTVFMAPTELLAEQHYKTIVALLKGIDVNIRILVGGQRSKLRRDVLADIQRGSAQIVVGTHALFEKEVEFARLGFVVIDEQHRFGVMQRASLIRKSINPDVLVMTATPIPRTLSLTLFGDLDVSVIDELPRDRKPIKTIIKFEEEKEGLFEFVRERIREGQQVYFVYPLIEESEKVDLKAATKHFEELQKDVFPDLRLGLLHGRLPSDEKEEIMEHFKRCELDILVATTVIEVGIDVPNASVMVIENAERFGLSQLHQLRGRVGRGSEQSYCILLTKRWIALAAGRAGRKKEALATAQDQQRLAERRLATMAATTDGFKIAEVDLELRGPGDFFGTRQSGMPEFKVADIINDSQLLGEARDDARAIIESDPRLSQPEHRPLADHLRLHFRDALAIMNVG